MPIPVPNAFTAWEFNNKELYAATRFSTLNLMLIQTLMAQEAQKKLNLKIDINGSVSREQAVERFVQQEAEITGGIEMLEHLLMLANETEAPSPDQEDSAASVAKPVAPNSLSTSSR